MQGEGDTGDIGALRHTPGQPCTEQGHPGGYLSCMSSTHGAFVALTHLLIQQENCRLVMLFVSISTVSDNFREPSRTIAKMTEFRRRKGPTGSIQNGRQPESLKKDSRDCRMSSSMRKPSRFCSLPIREALLGRQGIVLVCVSHLLARVPMASQCTVELPPA